MNPYLIAHALYTRKDRDVSWLDAMDLHLQHGAVISTPQAFVMARPIHPAWPPEKQLNPLLSEPSPIWHVWMAAGDLSSLFHFAHQHGVTGVTYQRHDSPRLRFLPLAAI